VKQYLSSGHLFKCVTGVACVQATIAKTEFSRRYYIEEEEIVEFRYPHDAHFRTVDDLYLYLHEEIFLDHFKIYGKIYEEVRWKNRNSTKEILDCRLYELIK